MLPGAPWPKYIAIFKGMVSILDSTFMVWVISSKQTILTQSPWACRFKTFSYPKKKEKESLGPWQKN